MVAAHTNAHIHIHRLNSNCPFLSVVETAGLCHVNERGGEVKMIPSFPPASDTF